MSIEIIPSSTETKDGRIADGRVIQIELFGFVIEFGLMRIR